MQTSALKRLLQPIKSLIIRREKESSEEISEQRAESNMTEDISQTSYEEGEDIGCDKPENNDVEDIADEASHPYSLSETHESVREGNLSHLTSSVPRVAKLPTGTIPKGELREIRAIFGNLDDAEIQRLYKRVTK